MSSPKREASSPEDWAADLCKSKDLAMKRVIIQRLFWRLGAFQVAQW